MLELVFEDDLSTGHMYALERQVSICVCLQCQYMKLHQAVTNCKELKLIEGQTQKKV